MKKHKIKIGKKMITNFAEYFNFIVHAPLTGFKNCDSSKIFIKSLIPPFYAYKIIND